MEKAKGRSESTWIRTTRINIEDERGGGKSSCGDSRKNEEIEISLAQRNAW